MKDIFDPACAQYIKDCERKINRKNRNCIEECIAVYEKWRTLKNLGLLYKEGDNQYNSRKGWEKNSPPYSAEELASAQGYTRRMFNIKKFIGKNLSRYIIGYVRERPELNRIFMLYKLAKLPENEQQRIVKEPMEKIKKTLGLDKEDNIYVPLNKDIYKKASKTYKEGELSITDDLNFYLYHKTQELEKEKKIRDIMKKNSFYDDIYIEGLP